MVCGVDALVFSSAVYDSHYTWGVDFDDGHAILWSAVCRVL